MAKSQQDHVEEIIRSAGRLLLSLKNQQAFRYVIEGTQVKAELDQIIHKFISSELKKINPHILIISEEDCESVVATTLYEIEECFIIDPIDGTASLVQGFKGYVIQIAYLKNGIPVFSFVYAPEYDDLYFGSRGAGAFLNGNSIKANKCPNQQVVFIDNSPKPSENIKKMMEKFQKSAYMESGSIGLKICKVADGTAHVFFKDVTVRDWDIIPPALILEEAGGSIASLEKRELVYFSNNDFSHPGIIVASNKELMKNVI